MKLWTARDKDGMLTIHFYEPILDGFEWVSLDYRVINEDMFPGVTFENSPQEVELKLIEISTEDIIETKSIPPYMDYDIKEDKGTLEQIDLTRELRIADEVEVILGDYEFVLKDGKTYFVKKKPQYPKTYKECCDVLGLNTMDNDAQGYKVDLIIRFQELIIARDAYWKIAGDWRPEFRFGKKKYCIMTKDNKVISATVEETNRILVFPTAEMRDEFYENFKDLIEYCKELL